MEKNTIEAIKLWQRSEFERWVVSKCNATKTMLVELRTREGYQSMKVEGVDINIMWECWIASAWVFAQEVKREAWDGLKPN